MPFAISRLRPSRECPDSEIRPVVAAHRQPRREFERRGKRSQWTVGMIATSGRTGRLLSNAGPAVKRDVLIFSLKIQ
jgi:hypothetical protein